MGLLHTISKIIMSISMCTGLVYLAASFGLIEALPPALNNANGGTGPDKTEWGAKLLGTTRSNFLILVGTCKLLAFVDVWLLNVVPRLACFCYAIMMAIVFYGHLEIGDDLVGPIVVGTLALITMATWPSAPIKGKQN